MSGLKQEVGPEAGGRVGALHQPQCGVILSMILAAAQLHFSWSPSDSAVNLSVILEHSKPFDKFLSSLNQPELNSVVCT